MDNGNGFRSLFQKSMDAQLLLYGEACIDCNDAALKMMGCTRKDQLIRYYPNDHSPPIKPDGHPSFDKAKEMIEKERPAFVHSNRVKASVKRLFPDPK